MKNKALKVLLFGLVRDFGYFDELNRYQYAISKNDFKDEFGKLLFRTVLKYKELGAVKLTKKIFEEESIKEEEVKKYFAEIESDWKDSYFLYIEEMVAIKAMEEFENLYSKLNEMKGRVDGKNYFQKADQFIELVHHKTAELKKLKKGIEGDTMLKLNDEFSRMKMDGFPIASGVKQVDQIFKGWKRGGVNLLSGVTNQGKTTFAIQCILYAVIVLKLKVKFINLEVGKMDLYAKIMGLISGEGYSAHNVDLYDSSKPEDREKHKKRATEDRSMIENMIKERLVIKAGTFTDEMIYQELRDCKAEGFDMCMIDYFSLVEVGGKTSEKTMRLTTLQERARSIVRNSDFALVWLTQLKEEVKKVKDENGKMVLETKPMEYEIAWCKDLYKGADTEVRVWREYENIETRTFTPYMFVGFKKTRYFDRVEPIQLGFDGSVGRIGGMSFTSDEKAVEKPDIWNNYDEDNVEYFQDAKQANDAFSFVGNLLDQAKEAEEDRARKEAYQKEKDSKVEELFGDEFYFEEV